MDFNKSAEIVALARICGNKEPAQTILEKYSQYYQETVKELSKDVKPNTVEVFKRPL